jgi:hypothetical protein
MIVPDLEKVKVYILSLIYLRRMHFSKQRIEVYTEQNISTIVCLSMICQDDHSMIINESIYTFTFSKSGPQGDIYI